MVDIVLNIFTNDVKNHFYVHAPFVEIFSQLPQFPNTEEQNMYDSLMEISGVEGTDTPLKRKQKISKWLKSTFSQKVKYDEKLVGNTYDELIENLMGHWPQYVTISLDKDEDEEWLKIMLNFKK